MKLMKKIGFPVSVCAAVLVTACQTSTPAGDSVQIFHVGPAMSDGVGAGSMSCLMVKQPGDSEYRMFYSPIAGFDYVPGYEYELKVRVAERENVPADASKYAYELVKVVSKEPSGPGLEGVKWAWTDRIPDTQVYVRFDGGKATGNSGLNRFFTGYELDGSGITVKSVAGTLRAGPRKLMDQEQVFMQAFGSAVTYRIVGEELRLLNEAGKVVLKFEVAVEPGLTSGVWEATGINNGKGGVASLLKDTEVTARFDDEGRISGNGGCNNFTGNYEAESESMKIGPLAVTRKMATAPAGIMEQEANVLKALGKTVSYRIDENLLELRDADGSLQITFILKAE